jgi:hypothetical protein
MGSTVGSAEASKLSGDDFFSRDLIGVIMKFRRQATEIENVPETPELTV